MRDSSANRVTKSAVADFSSVCQGFLRVQAVSGSVHIAEPQWSPESHNCGAPAVDAGARPSPVMRMHRCTTLHAIMVTNAMNPTKAPALSMKNCSQASFDRLTRGKRDALGDDTGLFQLLCLTLM